ncbi:alkaline phosphatase family protein [Natronomonas amylolytica]|uniref:alkaline phosphatase family protein n=1 Tax=Natronomonas amylolytica TaxID=3108498 RepID=UPI00300B8ACF
MSRTFVVGLDGASWELLEPWIEADELPNLESIRKDGSWATNRSCLPPVTFPNWKCYSSGKNPGKFGVFWFEHIDLEREQIDVMNGSSFDTAELWDYLNADGYSAGVVNMPTMYPPREIDEMIVCGGPDAVSGEYRSIESGYTYPSELADDLESRYDYRVHPEPLLSSNQERGEEVEEILDLLDLRLQVAIDALEERELDFVHVTLFYLNVLHHFFWNEEPTKRAWKIVDEWLGRIDELPDTNLVIMSDHGCDATTTEFYINEWLAENGYLQKTRTIEDYFQRFGLTRENVLDLAKRANLVDVLSRTVPEHIQKLVPQSAGVKRERKLDKIDVNHTKAVASGQGPIYLNPEFNTELVREKLVADLENVTDENGNPLFTNVYHGEDVYSGRYVQKGPEIVLDQRPGVHVNDGLGGGEIQTKPDRWAAENTPTGIFAAKGPDFEPCGGLGEIDIVDIAPTVLSVFDVPRPTDIDGEVLPIFETQPEERTQEPIRRAEASGVADEDVADRLKQLGYME